MAERNEIAALSKLNYGGLLDRLQPSQAHPYNSQLISVKETALSSVTYKNRTIPIEYFVLPVSCQRYLMVLTAQLKIITMF